MSKQNASTNIPGVRNLQAYDVLREGDLYSPEGVAKLAPIPTNLIGKAISEIMNENGQALTAFYRMQKVKCCDRSKIRIKMILGESKNTKESVR